MTYTVSSGTLNSSIPRIPDLRMIEIYVMSNCKNFLWVEIAHLSLYNKQNRRTSPINSEHPRDLAKGRFSIWRPSAILNLQYFDTLSHGRP